MIALLHSILLTQTPTQTHTHTSAAAAAGQDAGSLSRRAAHKLELQRKREARKEAKARAKQQKKEAEKQGNKKQQKGKKGGVETEEGQTAAGKEEERVDVGAWRAFALHPLLEGALGSMVSEKRVLVSTD